MQAEDGRLDAMIAAIDADDATPLRPLSEAPNGGKRRRTMPWAKPLAGSSSSITAGGAAEDSLPFASVDQPIVYSRSAAEAAELCDVVLASANRDGRDGRLIIGLDIEWQVTFEANVIQRPAAVLQLCTPACVYVFQLSAMRELPARLATLLEAEWIVKCGCKVKNDALKLQRDYGVRCSSLLDLGALAAAALPYGQRPWSLADLCVAAMGKRLSKDIRMSNWEAAPLSSEQIEYAARDAWVSRRVCLALLRRLEKRKEKAKQLEKQQPPQPQHQQHEAVSSDAGCAACIPSELLETIGMDAVERRRLAQAEVAAARGGCA